MAESEGFEPPIDLRLCLISSQVHSTGLCQLSVWLVYRSRPGARNERARYTAVGSVSAPGGFRGESTGMPYVSHTCGMPPAT
jgi:hypothetical protein